MARPRKQDQLTVADDFRCDVRVVHAERVTLARAGTPEPRQLAELGALFSALGDVTRLRIVAALAASELCVCDLAVLTGTSESAVSHHLRLLREIGLVSARREGRLAFYTLDDHHVAEIYRQGLEHVTHRLAGDTS